MPSSTRPPAYATLDPLRSTTPIINPSSTLFQNTPTTHSLPNLPGSFPTSDQESTPPQQHNLNPPPMTPRSIQQTLTFLNTHRLLQEQTIQNLERLQHVQNAAGSSELETTVKRLETEVKSVKDDARRIYELELKVERLERNLKGLEDGLFMLMTRRTGTGPVTEGDAWKMKTRLFDKL